MTARLRSLPPRTSAVVIGAALAISVAAGAAALASEHLLRAPIHDGETINILLLGSDEGPMRNSDPLRGRADAFQLLSVSPDGQHATFVSFPRDSYVSVPGRGNTRINACLTGGPAVCMATMDANWGFRPDHYIVTDFNGFKQAIHRFGGVTVNVDRPVSEGGTAITNTGRQRITGSQALAFTRERKSRPGGDFARTAAQAELLREAHAEVWENATPARIAQTVAILQQTTVTDLNPSQLLRLAYLAVTIDPENVDQVTLSGGFANIGGASVVQLTGDSHNIVRSVATDGRR